LHNTTTKGVDVPPLQKVLWAPLATRYNKIRRMLLYFHHDWHWKSSLIHYLHHKMMQKSKFHCKQEQEIIRQNYLHDNTNITKLCLWTMLTLFTISSSRPKGSVHTPRYPWNQ